MAHSPSQTEERWTYSVGEYPNTVLVVERRGPGTPLYSRYTLADGTRPWQSLGHKDKKLAKKWAVELNLSLSVVCMALGLCGLGSTARV